MYADSEALYNRWEASIQKLKDFRKEYNDAKLNHASILCSTIMRLKATESVTLAEKLAKGAPEVLEAEGLMLEAERMVYAGRETLDLLASKIVDIRQERKDEGKVLQ